MSKTFDQWKYTSYVICKQSRPSPINKLRFASNRIREQFTCKENSFPKIYQLPTSWMAACKDRLVNIPIYNSDIIETIGQLLRTPSEAGQIEVKLKRKI